MTRTLLRLEYSALHRHLRKLNAILPGPAFTVAHLDGVLAAQVYPKEEALSIAPPKASLKRLSAIVEVMPSH